VARVRPTKDIRPLAEFRANLASFVRQVRASRRPLILTQHGRGAAVLLAVEEYEALVEQVEVLKDVRQAERQIDQGHGLAHGKARTAVLAQLRR
jgi:prevent-host-death family protein